MNGRYWSVAIRRAAWPQSSPRFLTTAFVIAAPAEPACNALPAWREPSPSIAGVYPAPTNLKVLPSKAMGAQVQTIMHSPTGTDRVCVSTELLLHELPHRNRRSVRIRTRGGLHGVPCAARRTESASAGPRRHGSDLPSMSLSLARRCYGSPHALSKRSERAFQILR